MNLWLFAHLTSLATWLGALVFVAIFVLVLRKQLVSVDIRKVFVKLTKVFNAISHLSATVVLVSGVFLLINMGLETKPFWLTFMERAGGATVLISMIVITIFGRRVTKQLTATDTKKEVKGLTPYLSTMFVSIALIVSVIFVVAARIA
ncbi:MAG: hypothetical protein ACI35O_14645 [Bacillaceae bacterium]